MKLETAINVFTQNAKTRDDKRCAKRLKETRLGQTMDPTDRLIALLQVMLGRNDKAGSRDIHGKGKE